MFIANRKAVAFFVLVVNTGHILMLNRKTCALLREKTSAWLRRKTCAVLRARTSALVREKTTTPAKLEPTRMPCVQGWAQPRPSAHVILAWVYKTSVGL